MKIRTQNPRIPITRTRQQGLSALGWLLVIMVAGFALLCAFRVAPPYFDNIYVKDALKSLIELENPSTGFDNVTNEAIKKHLGNYFLINNVRGEATRAIEIERTRRKFLVNINYEVRVPLIYNIDVVMTFANQFDSAQPEACCKPITESASE